MTESTLPAWAMVSPERRAHIERVAGLVTSWADAMRVAPAERSRWLRAVWLHDALRDAGDARLAELAPSTPGPPELSAGASAGSAAVPLDESDEAAIAETRKRFEAMLSKIDSELERLGAEYDQTLSRETLATVRATLNRRKYIQNLVLRTEAVSHE